jgi:hypothetical protein
MLVFNNFDSNMIFLLFREQGKTVQFYFYGRLLVIKFPRREVTYKSEECVFFLEFLQFQ